MKPEGEIVWQVLRRVHYRLLNSGCCCSFLWLKLGWTYFSRIAVEVHQWNHSRPWLSSHSSCWSSCLKPRVQSDDVLAWVALYINLFANTPKKCFDDCHDIFVRHVLWQRMWVVKKHFFQCNGWLCQILPPLNEAEWWHPLSIEKWCQIVWKNDKTRFKNDLKLCVL